MRFQHWPQQSQFPSFWGSLLLFWPYVCLFYFILKSCSFSWTHSLFTNLIQVTHVHNQNNWFIGSPKLPNSRPKMISSKLYPHRVVTEHLFSCSCFEHSVISCFSLWCRCVLIPWSTWAVAEEVLCSCPTNMQHGSTASNRCFPQKKVMRFITFVCFNAFVTYVTFFSILYLKSNANEYEVLRLVQK